MSRRFRSEDWTELGLSLLSSNGPGALTIARLCTASGLTPGSFYHHFRDHAAFIDALALRWREKFTLSLIDASADGPASTRMRNLNELSSRLDAQVELGMRRLGATNERVFEVVRAVDSDRLDYLTRLHRGAGRSATLAKHCAKIEYAAFVGAQVLWPDLSAREAKKLGDVLSRMIEDHE